MFEVEELHLTLTINCKKYINIGNVIIMFMNWSRNQLLHHVTLYLK